MFVEHYITSGWEDATLRCDDSVQKVRQVLTHTFYGKETLSTQPGSSTRSTHLASSQQRRRRVRRGLSFSCTGNERTIAYTHRERDARTYTPRRTQLSVFHEQWTQSWYWRTVTPH